MQNIHFNSIPVPQPGLVLEEQTTINYDKFKKITEALSYSLTSSAKLQEQKIHKLAFDLDLNPHPIATTAIKILAVAFAVTVAVLALCTIIPFCPLFGWVALIFGAYSLFSIKQDAYEYLGIIMPESKRKERMENLAKILNHPKFHELSFLRSNEEFFKKIAQRIEENKFTHQDLKALLYIRERIRLAEENGEIDSKIQKLIADLEAEWVTTTRVRDWNDAFQEIT